MKLSELVVKARHIIELAREADYQGDYLNKADNLVTQILELVEEYKSDERSKADMKDKKIKEKPRCKWCDCEYPDHSCTECNMDAIEETCDKYQGLCFECQGGWQDR